MRYDKPIFFQRIISGELDVSTGNYDEDTVTEVEKMASVMDTGAEMLRIVYGNLKQRSKTVQLQKHYTEPFDRIRIDSEIYRVDFSRKLRTKHIFIVSEVQ